MSIDHSSYVHVQSKLGPPKKIGSFGSLSARLAALAATLAASPASLAPSPLFGSKKGMVGQIGVRNG